MRSSRRRASLLLLAAPLALLWAQPSYAQTERSDPWEGMNRRFYAIQHAIDRAFLAPLARKLSKSPSPLRRAIRNVTRNLSEPTVAVNDLLQGRVGTAASTVGRFAINTLFGVAGIMDVAERGRIPHHDNDFGMTLGRWGVGPGPYLFLPLMGPSTVRDGFGTLADVGLNPLTYVQYSAKTEVGISTTVADGLIARVDAEPQLMVIQQTSTDPYATIRSYFLQNRQHDITGREPELEPFPDIDTAAAPGPEPQPATPGSRAAEPPPATAPAPPPAEPRGPMGCVTGSMPP